MLRRLLPFLLVAAACNSADFTPAPNVDCNKTQCTCEQDPSQPTCKGYSGQPEGGTPLSDASPTLDATPADGAADASDGGEDGAADAGEDADAS